MGTHMKWDAAIQHVLGESAEAMHYKEIADWIMSQGLVKTVGATPASTVASYLSNSVRELGADSPYVRTERGVYALREALEGESADRGSVPGGWKGTPIEEDAQLGLITSFGMYWQRDLVDWTRTKPKVLGKQAPGATAVNFSEQAGVYLLYDGREVIYVGMADTKRLGARLREHLTDRLAARWDRFSWFGLRPVQDDGQLGDVPTVFSSKSTLPALEALLIEALEPRQNRRRGDGFIAAEYIQHTDENVQKKRAKKALEDVLG